MDDESFYSANSMAELAGSVIQGGSYSQESSDFFVDDKILSFIQPFPEESILQVFVGYLAERVLYDETTGMALDRVHASIPFSHKRPSKQPLVPVDEALVHHGFDPDGGFLEFLAEAGKKPSDADEDDLYDYFQELRLCGTLETLSSHIAERVFPMLFQDTTLLGIFNETVASYVADCRRNDLEVEHALLFAADGQLHPVQAPTWGRAAVAKRENGRCLRCGNAADPGQPRDVAFVPLVALKDGGLNDVTNLQMCCFKCGVAAGGL